MEQYELLKLSPVEHYWWSEGYVWGLTEANSKAEAQELGYLEAIQKQQDTIRAYELQLRGLRHEFTWRGPRSA